MRLDLAPSFIAFILRERSCGCCMIHALFLDFVTSSGWRNRNRPSLMKPSDVKKKNIGKEKQEREKSTKKTGKHANIHTCTTPDDLSIPACHRIIINELRAMALHKIQSIYIKTRSRADCLKSPRSMKLIVHTGYIRRRTRTNPGCWRRLLMLK